MPTFESFNWRKLLLPLGVCALAFAAAVVVCPLFGRETLNWHDVFFGAPNNMSRDIFLHARWPRIWTATLAGGGLALAGVAFQALLRNPLASPFTLGISAGASLGVLVATQLGLGAVVLGISPFTQEISALPLAAFVGCMATALLVAFLAGGRREWPVTTLLLGGVIIHFFFSSVILFLQSRARDTELLATMRWTMGSLNAWSFSSVWQTLVLAAPAVVILWALARPLNLLAGGDESARSRGVNTRRLKQVVFIAASALAAVIVSVTGPIGFVGIVVPHAVRLMFGADHRIVMPCSLLAGAAFLVVCDTAGTAWLPHLEMWARNAAGAGLTQLPSEVPVGVITALIGGPFFIWLLRKGKQMF